MKDYEKTYDDFWKGIVENEDGSLNLDQIKRELHDFQFLLENTSKVFDGLTGGRISKPNTLASVVISEVESIYEERTEDYLSNEATP